MVTEYYVYAYYFKSTGEIFYIGKGKGDRYSYVGKYRNKFFLNILSKHSDDVDVRFLEENLTNKEACSLEKRLIAEYWAIGQCKANLHEGGEGGNTGNYAQAGQTLSKYLETHERSALWYQSMRDAGLKRRGIKKTEIQLENQKASAKKSWEDKTTPGNIKRLDNLRKNSFKKGHTPHNKGKSMSKESYIKMMYSDCSYKYEVYFDDKLIYWTITSKKLIKFCKETFDISFAIINKLINGSWKPKFNKHKYLETLKIIRKDISVSTNRDECTDVEWRLLPFEVPGSLKQ